MAQLTEPAPNTTASTLNSSLIACVRARTPIPENRNSTRRIAPKKTNTVGVQPCMRMVTSRGCISFRTGSLYRRRGIGQLLSRPPLVGDVVQDHRAAHAHDRAGLEAV